MFRAHDDVTTLMALYAAGQETDSTFKRLTPGKPQEVDVKKAAVDCKANNLLSILDDDG